MSAMGSFVPAWIVADAFVDLLKVNIPNFKRIATFNVGCALAPGENYATNMLRVSIGVELNDKTIKNLSYMMKVPHDSPIVVQMLEFFNPFKIENLILNEILPEFEQIYRDVGVNIACGPTAYRLPQDLEGNYVLMDDLSVSGFRNVKRQHGLDIVHMESVLKLLAKHHAVSASRATTKGKYPELAAVINSEAMQSTYNGMMSLIKQTFLKHLKNYKNGEDYERSVNKFFDNLPMIAGSFFKADPTEFNVLLHGDCWCNNIMFKYTEANEIDDVIFVDFQMSRWGSPVYDLFYLIISSAQFDIKTAKFDYFIRFYHDHLIEELTLLKYSKPLPILRELFKQTFKYGDFGFMTATTTMAGVLVESSDKANADNFMSNTAEGTAFRDMLYANSEYNRHISALLPWFYNRGILTD